MKKTEAAPQLDQNLVKAVSHPLRVRVFMRLCEKIASPSELADELGEPLGNVAYHVQVLNKLGCLELVKTTPVRGAVEHHYRAVQRPFFSDDDWPKLPPPVKDSFTAAILAAMWDDFREGLEEGKFDRDDSHMSRTNLVLDQAGWEELRDMLNEVLDRAQELEAESAGRLAKSKEAIPVSSKLMLLHFERAGESREPDS